MPSPVRHRRHSRPNIHLCAWLGHYEAGAPGVEAGDNGSVRLDLDNEPQPDACLIIAPGLGGQARISDDDYLKTAFIAALSSLVSGSILSRCGIMTWPASLPSFKKV
ncbi:MAG: hypothetical protein JO114_09440 [Planctomycetaceae bacterium]|nr:hypothetical protein [Planctomycetaceae bacterium]MBV8313055.1 hypothetical protein [Planctomycetaceae bacterium]